MWFNLEGHAKGPKESEKQKQKPRQGFAPVRGGHHATMGLFGVTTPLGVFGLLSVNRLGDSTRGTEYYFTPKVHEHLFGTFGREAGTKENPCDCEIIGPLQIDIEFKC